MADSRRQKQGHSSRKTCSIPETESEVLSINKSASETNNSKRNYPFSRTEEQNEIESELESRPSGVPDFNDINFWKQKKFRTKEEKNKFATKETEIRRFWSKMRIAAGRRVRQMVADHPRVEKKNELAFCYFLFNFYA